MQGGGWGGVGGTFCLYVWESVVSAGWGVEEVLLFPSAGKQCFMARAGL